MHKQITLATAEGKTLIVDVLSATLDGNLAVHYTTERRNGNPSRGYTITHIPTGRAFRHAIRSFPAAEKAMLLLEEIGNWNFRSPRSPIWWDQADRIKAIVFALPQYPE